MIVPSPLWVFLDYRVGLGPSDSFDQAVAEFRDDLHPKAREEVAAFLAKVTSQPETVECAFECPELDNAFWLQIDGDADLSRFFANLNRIFNA